MQAVWERLYEFIGLRKQHYALTFRTSHGKAVLRDLAKFCRANETCDYRDPYIHAALEGRREVWLRIQQHLNLPEDQLAELYIPAGIQHPEERR